jgi:Flp pilus assembly protein TadB
MDQMKKPNRTDEKSPRNKSTLSRVIALVVLLLVALVSATELHGWHMYVGFAFVAAGMCIALLSFKRKHAGAEMPPNNRTTSF